MASVDRSTPPALAQRARRRVALKQGFFLHARVFVLLNGGLYLVSMAAGWGMDSGWGYRHGGGHFLPRWGWALGLAIHGTVVFLRLQGQGMTQRRVDREIEALKRRDSRPADTGSSSKPGADTAVR